MKRVRSLLRLSSKAQVHRKGADADIPDQRDIIARFLKDKPDWTLSGEYVEAGVSAFKKRADDRDVLQDAIRDAKAGQYDILLLWKGDRLARRVTDMPGIVEDLASVDVEVWSVIDAPGGKYWTAKTAMDLFMLSLEGFKNQSESEGISIRTKAKKQQMAEAGQWRGSRIPYGYQLIAVKDAHGEPVVIAGRTKRQLAEHPEHGPILREMYRRYLAGEGYLAITRWLNESGLRTANGKLWDHTQVRAFIKNPFYMGYSRNMVKGQHPALVAEDTWYQAQAIAEAKANIPRRQLGAVYLLTGILYCGICGARMGAETRPWKKKGPQRVYRCRSWRKGKPCGLPIVLADLVEAKFVAAVQRETQPTSVQSVLREQDAEARRLLEDFESRQRQYEQRLKAIEAAVGELTVQFLEHRAFAPDEYKGLKVKYATEKEQVEAALREAPPRVAVMDWNLLGRLMADICHGWHTSPRTQQKQDALDFCTAYNSAAYLYPDGDLEIHQRTE